jgi:hypothetical protein
VEFFERQKQIPYTEGVVVKERDSVIPAHLDECHKTGLWQKIKWRSGHDGREVVA